jgi:hypothetical protein
MSQKGKSNLKFARYPLEKSSRLASLELKSKLLERLTEHHCALCKSGGQCSFGRIVLPTVWRTWEMWNKKITRAYLPNKVSTEPLMWQSRVGRLRFAQEERQSFVRGS